MLPFAFYLLKVIICSGILLGYYWLMLRNKIYHRYNRFYLLATAALSLIMPLVQINIWHRVDAPAQGIKLLQVVTGSGEYLDEIILTSRRDNFTTEQFLLLLYLLTSVIFLFLFVRVLLKIRTLLKQHEQTVVDKICFVNTTAKGTPFSFLKYIFWNNNIEITTTTGNQIFKHELAHVQQKHSLDKLFINSLLIIFWCNPFFWLIRKELNMIHEFMADKIAVEDSDTEAFAAMILQATYPQHRFALTNPFFYSPIKRRLLMLTKNKNPKAGYIGRILVLPLAVVLFAAFTLKTKMIKTSAAPAYEGKKITVVIDAGHGGKDFGSRSLDGSISEKDLSLAIVKKIKSLNNNSNINIILTRDNDIYQSPKEKADFSNEKNADLFITIHLDAISEEEKGTNRSGLSVWVAKDNFPNALSSKLFASAIINEFNTNYQIPVVVSNPQQGQKAVWVLQASNCPAVLIEAGFITNIKDLAYVQSEEGQKTIAKNVLAAIEKYAVQQNAAENTSANKQSIADTVPKNISAKREFNSDHTFDNLLCVLNGKIMGTWKTFVDKNKGDSMAFSKLTVLTKQQAIAKYGKLGKNGAIEVTTIKKELVFKTLPGKTSVDTILQIITVAGDTTPEERVKQETEKKPLYIIDGKIQSQLNDINSLDPTEIESISVLKGENAVSKYGEAAKNGVVEINMKKISSNNTDRNSKDDKVFTQVENEARFPGGEPAWRRYLEMHLNPSVPLDDRWRKGTYEIIVSFKVNKDGSIEDIKTDNYQGSKTADECINLIKKGPRWVPALQNGHNVTAYKKQPITFVVMN
jgi:N-acetylmuramoyl-L-alanine amidase